MSAPHPPRLPRLARWALRLVPVPRESRADVEADLLELFTRRRRDHGVVNACWRLAHDLTSLRRKPRAAARAEARLGPVGFVRDVRADFGYVARLFRRQPAAFVLTLAGLALGLGIATAAFSLMNVAVLRGTGLVDPDRAPGVLRITENAAATNWSYDEFLHLREGGTRVQINAVAAEFESAGTIDHDTDAPRLMVAFVTGGFFAATGGRIQAGRPLVAADERHPGPPPVVVSSAFWRSRLDRDPAAIGRTIEIGRAEAIVVGVAAPGFSVPWSAQLWTPLTAYGAVHGTAAAASDPDVTVQVFGRLLPNVSLTEAEAQLGGVAAALPTAAPVDASRFRVRLAPDAGLGRELSTNNAAISLLVLAGIGLVVLLVCANVATILVAMALTREREMGVRAALGAGRGRIVRQLVAEGVALGAIAAPVGLLCAYWAMPTVGVMIGAPPGLDLAPDLRVYAFLGLVTIVTGVLAGLAPAWHSRGADLVSALKADGARPRATPGRVRFTLVMTQTAASVLLIIIAALLLRATLRVAAIDTGFEASGLYVVSPNSIPDDEDRRAAVWTRAVAELPSVPGVEGVALAQFAPLGPFTTARTQEEPSRHVYRNRVHAGYFETLGVPLLDGRRFTSDELATAAPVVVISESLARAYWPDGSAVGDLLPPQIPLDEVRPIVVGVVEDAATTTRLEGGHTLAVYEPLASSGYRSARLLVRVSPDAAAAIEDVRRRLLSFDREVDPRIDSIAARQTRVVSRPGMLAALTGFVGVVAIILCGIGLYGLTASLAAQRAREMSVRAAMGAEPRDLLGVLLRDSLRPVVVGLAAGVAVAFVGGQALSAEILFGVSPRDPIAYVGAATVLLAAATLAVLAPARRAAVTDPALILKGP